jgi:peptidoglycan/xylan/chitin deacetylase (PgdA/CDA1 family)
MAAAATMALRGTFRRALISAGLESFHILGRAGIAARKRGRGIIFTLHHVRPFVPSPFAVNAHLEITPGFLDETLATLKNDGYEPIALGDLPTRLAGPDDGRRYFAFTMDDGYRNNRDHALPVFEKHGVPFTVYVAAGFIDRSRSLWWDTAALLVGAGEPLTLDFNGGTEILSTATMREKHHAFGRIADAIRSPAFDDNVAALDRGALARGLDTRALVEASVMDAAELREFARHPLVSLGAHSVTHTSLAHMDADRLRQELVV